MESWLEIVLRQITLYSLPVLISLTLATYWEASWQKKELDHPFVAISNRWTWLPFLASIFFTRGIIIAPSYYLKHGFHAASFRLSAHIILCAIGFFLYAMMLKHAGSSGLPPLHHWWAKVLMYFNLCMACLHLLPLPRLWMGELIYLLLSNRTPKSRVLSIFSYLNQTERYGWLLTLLAASSLLDILLGIIIFPVYETLATWAAHMRH